MTEGRRDLGPAASAGALAAFLRQLQAIPAPATGSRGRLMFAMDATASREPSWDQAMSIQAAMFSETASLGGLAVQLCHYGGFHEFTASPWCHQAEELLALMVRVRCLAGLTQIGRVLEHAIAETRRTKVNALVLVGDAMEEEPACLRDLAGQLGLLGLPVFVFQEGRDPQAEPTLRDIARLSGGAWSPFDAGSPGVLRELLSAVAVYAAGGRTALEDFAHRRGGAALRLTRDLGRN
ncbi:MAG: VWA domain-containing protein [Gammaproteobacteria bacterium]|nr:VWA domain-containing protein [Candidatus Thioaporhodococcus sediminis]TNF53540.1 MAG: VWA domain-containing protein [Gammaproteobacteria bacterium]